MDNRLYIKDETGKIGWFFLIVKMLCVGAKPTGWKNRGKTG